MPVGVSAVLNDTLQVREVWDSIPGPVKSDILANGSPPLLCFFGAVKLTRKATETDSATRYTLRRNTASIMKIWFFFATSVELRYN